MKLNEMKTRQEVINWAPTFLDHHYMHQAGLSPPRQSITGRARRHGKLVLFLN
jgi:hypothetical protein